MPGTSIAKLLIYEFGSIDHIAEATEEAIDNVPGIGRPEIAASVFAYFRQPKNQALLGRLRKQDFRSTASLKPKPAISEFFSGKTFVLTGTLNTMA